MFQSSPLKKHRAGRLGSCRERYTRDDRYTCQIRNPRVPIRSAYRHGSLSVAMKRARHHRPLSTAPSSSAIPTVRKRGASSPKISLHPRKKRKRGVAERRQKWKRRRINEEEEEGNRRWVFSPRDYSSYKDRFVVVSYNILGVENASKHKELYNRIPPQNLDWDLRKILILRELNLYMPSILCFQEVDCFDDLAGLLKEGGFRGIFKGRTGEACDGCAIFWREDLLTVLHQEDLEFQKLGLRDNVAQFCVLKMNVNQSDSPSSNIANPQMAWTGKNRCILVGNIHVLFNPKRGDIKLGQVRVFLETAHRLSQEWGNIPVVLAGDLNSMPQSAIYQFFASSELDILMHDRRNMSDQIQYPSRQIAFEDATRSLMYASNSMRYRWSEEETLFATGSGGCTYVRHHLKLQSAYVGVPGNRDTRDSNGEPLVTSYHSQFMGTVDYIWHSEELVPVRVVETLPINILRKTGGLPSEKWGSDHLALVCEMAFADGVNKTNA